MNVDISNKFNFSEVHGATCMNHSGFDSKVYMRLWGSFTLHVTHRGSYEK